MNRRYKTCLKLFMLAPVAMLISGCMAMPTAFTIASLAADGISLAATGKSVGMNALSLATNKDCSFNNVLDGIDVCQDLNGNDPITLLALNTPARSHNSLDFDINDLTIQLEADPLYDHIDQDDPSWGAVGNRPVLYTPMPYAHQADFDAGFDAPQNTSIDLERPSIKMVRLDAHVGSLVSP